MQSPWRIGALAFGVCLWSTLAIAQNFPAVVIGVTAGDIYQVDNKGKKELVVLYGVVAPPSPAAARQAREAGIQKALGQKVTVRVVERRPAMTLVELTLPDNTNLGQYLLRNGFVQWDSLTAGTDQGLKDLEMLARQDQLGIWAGTTPTGGQSQIATVAPAAAEAVRNERRFERRISADYDIVEGRAYTDEKGVPNLVLRGNGQKIIGFENAVEQQRIDDELAAIEEAEWAAMDAAIAQAEAERQAAEQQRLLDEAAARETQMQNMQLLNDMLMGRNRLITVSPY